MAENVRILVIDDEPGVLESFKMILKIKDYEVTTFEDGTSALKSFEKGKYDVAFIDMKLQKEPVEVPPDFGLEVLKKLKAIDPDIEVIIVTAYATDATHANAITLGALEYLRKPFLMEEIYELVERALRRKRAKLSRKEELGPLGPIH
ncbi:MAG: response regulator [Candidatus Margulisiibacteriota bacterium]